MKKTIYLIRHGESEHNVKNLFSGTSDVSLSKTGIDQCRKLAEQTGSLGIQSIYSSPLRRAVESAQLIFPGRKIKAIEGLIEINYGKYEGVNLNHVDEVTKAWKLSPDTLTFPGGDSVREYARNIHQTITKIVKNESSPSLAFVFHRTAIRLFIARILKLSIKYFRNIPCDNCHVFILQYDGKKYQAKTINTKYVVEPEEAS